MLEVGDALDGFFAISTRAYGEPLENLNQEGWLVVLPSLFAALATMRTVDLSATKGCGGWDSTGNASSSSWREYLLAVDQDTPSLRTHGWRQKLIEAPGGDVLFRRGHAKLAELTGNYIESTRTEFIFEQSGRVPVRENFETVEFKREELEGGGVRYTNGHATDSIRKTRLVEFD